MSFCDPEISGRPRSVMGALTRVYDRTRNWSEFAEGGMTGLGTRVCQGGVTSDPELPVCQDFSEFEKPKIGVGQHWLEFCQL